MDFLSNLSDRQTNQLMNKQTMTETQHGKQT